jgi:hypothetical protein
MKKLHVFTVLCLLLCLMAQAQTDPASSHLRSPDRVRPDGKNSLVGFDIHLPVGVFARSHFAGAGINYAWSSHRFGMNVHAKKLIGFTFNTGVDFYFGKKIKPAGYDFRYTGYDYLHAFAGVMANPWPNGNISLTAGPTAGIYRTNWDLGFGSMLSGSYYLKKNIAIGPGVTFKKHSKADPLWGGVVRIAYLF